MTVPIELAAGLAAALFAVGVLGVLLRRHVVALLLCVQLMLAGGLLLAVAFARLHGDSDGHVLAAVALVAAAAEAMVGFAVATAFFRARGSVDVEQASELRW